MINERQLFSQLHKCIVYKMSGNSEKMFVIAQTASGNIFKLLIFVSHQSRYLNSSVCYHILDGNN